MTDTRTKAGCTDPDMAATIRFELRSIYAHNCSRSVLQGPDAAHLEQAAKNLELCVQAEIDKALGDGQAAQDTQHCGAGAATREDAGKTATPDLVWKDGGYKTWNLVDSKTGEVVDTITGSVWNTSLWNNRTYDSEDSAKKACKSFYTEKLKLARSRCAYKAKCSEYVSEGGTSFLLRAREQCPCNALKSSDFCFEHLLKNDKPSAHITHISSPDYKNMFCSRSDDTVWHAEWTSLNGWSWNKLPSIPQQKKDES